MRKNDFIFTQTKEVVMTFDKTVTVETEKLETVNAFGRRMLVKKKQTEYVDIHDMNCSIRRVA